MRRTIAVVITSFIVACAPTAATPPPTATPTAAPTPSPTPTASPTPTPEPTQEPAVSYFKPLTGYEWVIPPVEVDRAMTTALDKPEITNIIAGTGLRLITRSGDPVNMFLLVMALKPSYAALPGALDGIGKGFSTLTPVEVTIAGRRALSYATTPKVLLWAHRSFIVVLYGAEEAPMTSFASLVISANQ